MQFTPNIELAETFEKMSETLTDTIQNAINKNHAATAVVLHRINMGYLSASSYARHGSVFKLHLAILLTAMGL
jgi:hypothetical protein